MTGGNHPDEKGRIDDGDCHQFDSEMPDPRRAQQHRGYRSYRDRFEVTESTVTLFGHFAGQVPLIVGRPAEFVAWFDVQSLTERCRDGDHPTVAHFGFFRDQSRIGLGLDAK